MRLWYVTDIVGSDSSTREYFSVAKFTGKNITSLTGYFDFRQLENPRA
jgi:hypothetical protein